MQLYPISMKKKPSSGSGNTVSHPVQNSQLSSSPDDPQTDLWLYARSFHAAAKELARAFNPDTTLPEFDISPVAFVFRHALELHLKALVLAEGGNFLGTRPDGLSIQKTHSVSWLAHFVCQIITALKWESEFKCERVQNLAEFNGVTQRLPIRTSDGRTLESSGCHR